MVLHPPTDEADQVTILSIDGGGLQGIFAAVVLKHLEDELKKFERDDSVRIADYFDVIAGTGTGSLVAAMLAKPSEEHSLRPQFDMKDIISFLTKISRKGFPHHFSRKEKCKEPDPNRFFPTQAVKYYSLLKSKADQLFEFVQKPLWFLDLVNEVIRALISPDGNGQELERLVKEELKDTRLDEALTNVVVPAFSMNSTRATVFSTNKAKILHEHQYDPVTLTDVVLSSVALPTILPIRTPKIMGEMRRLADGSIVAHNPTLLGLHEGARLYKTKENYQNCLVLSIGNVRRRSTAKETWKIMQWYQIATGFKARVIFQPLYNMFSDMTEIYLTNMLPEQNYLRIQEFDPTGENIPLFNDPSEAGLKVLKKLGNDILGKPASLVDPNTGTPYPQIMSYRERLSQFAERLCVERKRRERNCARKSTPAHEHKGD